MTSIRDIPRDIFMNNIATNFDISTVENMSSVSNAYQKEELVKNLIESNVFLQENSEISSDDLICAINHGYFTFQDFQEILEAICRQDKDAIAAITFTDVETSADSINGTFKMFQLFKECAINSESSAHVKNVISDLLMSYYDELFKKRSGFNKFESSTIGYCFRSDNCEWHNIDINPYYLYENMNHMIQSDRSFYFRQNMENKPSILVNDTYKNQAETISFLAHIMGYGNTCSKIYVFYEMIKYMNDIHKHSYLPDKVNEMCITKIKEFRPIIEKCTYKTPAFFKKIVFEEFDIFLNLKMNKV